MVSIALVYFPFCFGTETTRHIILVEHLCFGRGSKHQLVQPHSEQGSPGTPHHSLEDLKGLRRRAGGDDWLSMLDGVRPGFAYVSKGFLT